MKTVRHPKRHAFNHADAGYDVDLILTGSEGNSVVTKQSTCEHVFVRVAEREEEKKYCS